MPDKLRIRWSLESSRKIDSIKTYLFDGWDISEVNGFLKDIKRFESLVLRFPKLYPASLKHPKLRKAVISKHHSILYTIDDNIIRVYTVLDHRQQN